MTTFLALYRGDSIAEAKLVAVSAKPSLITFVVNQLLDPDPYAEADPVRGALEHGQRVALRLIKQEVNHRAEETSMTD